jgi:hypothetical protein
MEGQAGREEVGTTVQDPEFWRELRDCFQTLADEQRTIVRAVRQGNRRLRAYCGYNSDVTTIESELVRLELVCLLYRIESGTWQLGAGPNEDLKARFEALATRAGILLSVPQSIAPRDFWLHSLCVYLRSIKSENLFGCTDAGGYIEDVCQASATLCSWLERKALEARPHEWHGNDPQNEREKVVQPILVKKGWSIHDWAIESEVDFHTANDYLKGKTTPHPSTRKKLADSLGICVRDLPL